MAGEVTKRANFSMLDYIARIDELGIRYVLHGNYWNTVAVLSTTDALALILKKEIRTFTLFS